MSITAAPRPAASSGLQSFRWQAPDRLIAHALIAVAAFLAYVLARMLEGSASIAFSVIGVSACGWAWLLARALFDPARHDAVWPRAAVAVLAIAGAISVLVNDGGLVSAIATNLYVLSGSAALVLTLVEPFQRHGCELSRSERRFRIMFIIGFAGLAGVSVLGVWIQPDPIRTASAIFGLGAVVAATAFRLRHPLQVADRRPKRPATNEDIRLGQRLMALLRDEAIYADPDLRISDVAARLGEPEHRVSRCVGTALGFANFNRLINHHRIDLAKHLLSARHEERSILEIALDCGFASIGPFNRAFKAETGMTPRAWRAAGLGVGRQGHQRPTDPQQPERQGDAL